MNSIVIEILIVFLLILANGIFALSEMALISARKTRLQQKAEKGDDGARTALALAKEPTRFLSTVQVGITLIGILTGAFGGATIAEEIAAALNQAAWLQPYSEAIGVGVVVLVITYFSLILGELVPKRIALNNAENIAAKAAAPMSFIARFFTPIVSLLSVSTDATLRLLGIKPSREPTVTEEEVKLMIYEGAQTGVFEETEQEIVARVFRLGDRRASSLMTYRTEIVFLDIEDPLALNLEKVVQSGHSRFPVCRGNSDDILGIALVKDLFALAQSGVELDLQSILQPAVFVPEATSALELVEHLREKKTHLALIIDEFGGVIGMVTINDVLEAIVGDIPALEDKIREPDVIQREDGSFLLDGTLSIEEIKDLLNLDRLPNKDDAGYETLGGMLMAETGRIPTAGDAIAWRGWRFEVVDMDGYRVDKVLTSRSENSA
ncbi:MAG: hemolysin family protein [Chloroflexi bacterium]|nr:hemolysin family protein [Chloroflexota bacterium]